MCIHALPLTVSLYLTPKLYVLFYIIRLIMLIRFPLWHATVIILIFCLAIIVKTNKHLLLLCLGVQNEAGQRLIEFCHENALVIANNLFQQNKRRLYTWTSPDGQHRNQSDYILCSQRWRSFIQSAKKKKKDQELTVAQIMSSLLPNSDLN